jgi:hypothetical protein
MRTRTSAKHEKKESVILKGALLVPSEGCHSMAVQLRNPKSSGSVSCETSRVFLSVCARAVGNGVCWQSVQCVLFLVH